MKNFLRKGGIGLVVILWVLIMDEVMKVIVKREMYWDERIGMRDWF